MFQCLKIDVRHLRRQRLSSKSANLAQQDLSKGLAVIFVMKLTVKSELEIKFHKII